MKRIITYDCSKRAKRWWLPWKPEVWWAIGARFQKLIGQASEYHPIKSVEELILVFEKHTTEPVQIEYWSHGFSGGVVTGENYFHSFTTKLVPKLHPDSLVWWRSCGNFQGVPGRNFANQCLDAFGCAVAGHTYIISIPHSGLRCIRKQGQRADWDIDEGVKPDGKSYWSNFRYPRTVSVLATSFPKNWSDGK